MANMKMVALIDAEVRRAREQTAAEIVALVITTAQALASIEQKITELRRDVDALMHHP